MAESNSYGSLEDLLSTGLSGASETLGQLTTDFNLATRLVAKGFGIVTAGGYDIAKDYFLEDIQSGARLAVRAISREAPGLIVTAAGFVAGGPFGAIGSNVAYSYLFSDAYADAGDRLFQNVTAARNAISVTNAVASNQTVLVQVEGVGLKAFVKNTDGTTTEVAAPTLPPITTGTTMKLSSDSTVVLNMKGTGASNVSVSVGKNQTIKKVEVVESSKTASQSAKELTETLKQSATKIDGAEVRANGSDGEKNYTYSVSEDDLEDKLKKQGVTSQISKEEVLDENNVNQGYLVDNDQTVTTSSGTITFGKLADMIYDQAEAVAGFFSDYANDLENFYGTSQGKQQLAAAFAQIAVRLANGEDLNTVITEISAQLLLNPEVSQLFNELVADSNIIPQNYQTHVSNALTMFTVNSLLNGGEDMAQALQNASVQAAIQGAVTNNGGALLVDQVHLRDLNGNYMFDSEGSPIYGGQLNAAGVGFTAAAISLASSLLNGGINGDSVKSAAIAGATAYASAAITTALVGTAATSTAAATAGAFALYGAYAGPIGIAIGFAIGYLTKGLFAPTQYIHGETISHITQVQADGSLLLIGTREAGSLLRTTGTTNDDYVGNDSADDSAGADVIVGQAGMNEIYARGGHDFMEGRAAADYIDAGTGDDHVEAGDGDDYVVGGKGNDRIYGGNGDDILLGDGVDGTTPGGDDVILGGDGNDRIEGGAGKDQLYGGSGADQILGGAGNDVLEGGAGDDILAGEAGNDEIDGGDGNDTVQGGDGDDIMAGGAGNDNLEGNSGNDIILGDSGVDVLYGHDGYDTLYGGDDSDLLFGGLDDDVLAGGNGDDDLYGELGYDLLIGGRGNDLLVGGDLNDLYLFFRGDGHDTVEDTTDGNNLKLMDMNVGDLTGIVRAGDSLTFNFGADDSITLKDYFLTPNAFYKLEFANQQALTLSAITFDTSGNGSFTSLSTQNVFQYALAGLEKYQKITTSFSPAIALSTSWVIDNFDARVTTDATETELYNDVQVRSWSKGGGLFKAKKVFFYDYYEQFLQGSGSSDRIVGLFAAETINGQANNDQLYGNGGNDTIYGGVDHDLIYGGAGNDTINGDDGNDKIFGGSGDDNIFGGTGNDSLEGEQGADTLNGEAGDDLISGGDGNDTINGGVGRDILFGDDGDDTLNGGDGDDYLNGGNGNNTLNAGAGNDLLIGGSGNDILNGDAGDDLVLTGGGTDTADGGAGTDTLVLSGRAVDYNVEWLPGGLVRVTDRRPAMSDGVATLSNFEQLQFADKALVLNDIFPTLQTIRIAQGQAFSGSLNLPVGYAAELVQAPALGNVSVQANGAFVYDAPDVYTGGTSFTYKLTSPDNIQRMLTSSIIVQAPSIVPAAFALAGSDVTVASYTYNTSVYTNSGYPREQTTRSAVRSARLVDGGFVLTWTSYGEDGATSLDVFGQRYDASGEAMGAKFRVNTTMANHQSFATPFALNDGGFGVVYSSWGQAGDTSEGVFLQRFTATGTKVGGEVHVNESTPGLQKQASAVQLNDGNLFVVWGSNHITSSVQRFYGRVYDQAGNGLSGEFGIGSAIHHSFPRISLLNNGNILVTFYSFTNGADIYGSIFDAQGQTVVPDFLVNTSTSGNQRQPVIASMADGGFVIAWTSTDGQDGDQGGIYGQRYNASGVKIGTEFRINATTVGDQYAVEAIGLMDGGFYMAWTGPDGSGSGIYGQRFDANGVPVDGETLINATTTGDQYYPSLLQMENGDIQVSWQSFADPANPQVVTRRLTSVPQSGVTFTAASSGETLVGGAAADTLLGGAGNDVLVGNGGNDTLDGGAGTDTAVFNGNLATYTVEADGQEILVTKTADGSVDLLSNIEKLQFTDQSVDMSQFPGIPDMTIVQGFHYDGILSLPAGMTATLVQGPLVGSFQFTGNGNYRMAAPEGFEGDLTVRYLLTAPNGVSMTNEFIVTVPRAEAGQYAGQSEITVGGYNLQRTLYADVYEKESVKLGRREGGYVAVWSSFGDDGSDYGVYAQLFDANDQKVGTRFRVNNTTANQQYAADVQGLTDGSFIVTWTTSVNVQNEDNNDAYMRRFAADGTAMTGQLRLNNSTSGNDMFSRAELMPNGDVLFAWSKWLNATNSHDIYIRRYNSSLTSLMSETSINVGQSGTQREPVLTALNTGGYVVAWQDQSSTDGSGHGVYMRVFDSGGIPIGNDIRVNTTTSGNQAEPAVAALQAGSFIVTWVSASQDGSGDGVYARRYDHNGAALSGEFRVNTTTADNQNAAAITALQDGGFLITWQSMAQDGSSWGIYGQRYDADAAVVGSEFQVNQLTAGEQVYPDVIEMPNGDLVFAWQSIDANGVGTVKARRFTSSGNYNMSGDVSANIFVGGGKNDALSGGAGDDVLMGNGGDDQIDGGAGNDVAVFEGNIAGYNIVVDGANVVVIDTRAGSPDGSDTLANVETLKFADQIVDLEGLFPVLGDLTIPQGQGFHYTLPNGVIAEIISQGTIGTASVDSNGQVISYSSTDRGVTSFSYKLIDTATGISTTRTQSVNVTIGKTLGYQWQQENWVANFIGAGEIEGSVNTIQKLKDGSLAVVYHSVVGSGPNYGLWVRRYDANLNLSPSVVPVQVAAINQDQTEPRTVALNDGGFMLVWSGYNGGNNLQLAELYMQRFDAQAQKVGGHIMVNVEQNGAQMTPSMTVLANGDLVIAYDTANFPAGGYQWNQHWTSWINVRHFDQSGNPISSEIRVTESDGITKKRSPAVVALDNGGYMLAYQLDDQSMNGTRLYGQLMNASGTKNGGEFVISEGDTIRNITTSAKLSDGSVMIVWSAYDGSNYGLFGRRYSAEGAPAGNEFILNPGTVGAQQSPSIAALSDGGFFVTWMSQNDGVSSGWDVWGKRFDRNGNIVGNGFVDGNGQLLGSSIRLNTVTSGQQMDPTVAEMDDGDLVIAWQHIPTSGQPVITMVRYNATLDANHILDGTEADNILVGGSGSDELRGFAGNDDLRGGAGSDYLNGGTGDDVYRIEIGGGVDHIDNQDAAGNDVVAFGSGIERDDLWFSQSGFNLNIDRLGTDDRVVIDNWYAFENQKVDTFTLADGSSLDKSQVDLLVQAMAGFNPSGFSATGTLADLPPPVQNAITASWQ